jgi:DNA-directed RNA polymerase subunit K/omega
MKFVDLDDIYKKYPNKYAALVLAGKEVRKIIDANKPSPRPRDEEMVAATAVPEVSIPEPQAPKKRGRKPKKPVTETAAEIKPVPPKLEPEQELFTAQIKDLPKGRGVVVEKTEANPYIAGLKKILE